VLAVQVPLLTVQRNVALVPAAIDVTVVVLKDGFVIVALPATMLHAPVPTVGAVAFIVKVLMLHCSISATPASAVLGTSLLINNTSSVVGVHVPLLTVHLNVAVVPTGTPVTGLVAEDDVVMLAVPPTTLHAPVPVPGAVAPNVKLPLLH
jgi:hypothetical protein